MQKNNKFVMIATWSMAQDSLIKNYQSLKKGAPINEVLVDAISMVEDYPYYKSVGYGGLPNRNGKVQLDASFMDGTTMQIGCVAALEGFANPIKIAYQLKDYSYNSFLVGDGARDFAIKHGFTQKNMLTKRALHLYEERVAQTIAKDLVPYSGHDTVCIVGMDLQMNSSAATSTSGLFMKENGRVGDSPISGSGFYANSSAGACAATGLGEDIMKTCISYEVVRLMGNGIKAQKAADMAIKAAKATLLKRYGKCGDISIVCTDQEGRHGSATTIEEFSYVYCNEMTKPTVMLVTNEGKHEIASQQWLQNYYDTRHKELE